MADGSTTNTPVGSNQVPATQSLDPVEETEETQPASQANSETEDVDTHTSPNKRGLTSEAWKHFKRQKIDEKWKAICKYCDKKIGGDPKNGTKHLHDHLKSCKLRTQRTPRQSIIKTLAQGSSSIKGRGESIIVGNYTFDQENARKELAMMIVLHEYPLGIVDHVGFKRFCASLQPLFKVVSRNTIKNDILKIFETEKMATMKLLESITSRIAITTDMWTSNNQNKGYMSITAHFIDDNWSLQSRVVRFIYVPAPHTAEVLAQVLVDSLFDWNLDRKLSTITVDNCSTNDAMIDRIFDKVASSSFILGGSLFHMRCCAHILNLIVKDGLSTISSTIAKIRESVTYWVGTPKREEKFIDTCRQLQIEYSTKLVQDCRTRWNSTYLMLASAIPYKLVFERVKVRESQFKCCPSEEDWKMAEEICEKLEVFYSVTELFSGSRYPTANICFPKVCEIRLSLAEWSLFDNITVAVMAESMMAKFEKYWGVINGVMAIGAILDPRYKMKILNYFFPLIYGTESAKELQKVRKLLDDLVDEYQAKDKRIGVSTSDSTTSSLGDGFLTKKASWKSNYFQYIQETALETSSKSELDHYLEESVLLDKSIEEEFDILGYWKQIGVKYPTLQRIARYFLAIPISTVASESAFSTGGRILSPHRSRLKVDTVEAMMCCQDWLRSSIEGSSKGKTNYSVFTEDMDVDDVTENCP